jgi:hypothetical protein
MPGKVKYDGFPVEGTCFYCGCTDDRSCKEGCSWANRKHTLCSRCGEKLNKLKLMDVAIAAIVVARNSVSKDRFFDLVGKKNLEILKRELRKFAPGCLGKE